MPQLLVKSHWGSMSIKRTFEFSASIPAILKVFKVFPVPPFNVAMVIIFIAIYHLSAMYMCRGILITHI